MIKSIFLCNKFSAGKQLKNLPYIISARRTSIGKFMGRMSQFKGTELANFAIQGTLMSANVKPELVDEVIMNCSLTAGMGQSPTRQASI